MNWVEISFRIFDYGNLYGFKICGVCVIDEQEEEEEEEGGSINMVGVGKKD